MIDLQTYDTITDRGTHVRVNYACAIDIPLAMGVWPDILPVAVHPGAGDSAAVAALGVHAVHFGRSARSGHLRDDRRRSRPTPS